MNEYSGMDEKMVELKEKVDVAKEEKSLKYLEPHLRIYNQLNILFNVTEEGLERLVDRITNTVRENKEEKPLKREPSLAEFLSETDKMIEEFRHRIAEKIITIQKHLFQDTR